MKKSNNNNIFDTLSSTASGARLLLETIIEDYGTQDFLLCTFFGLNEADQERFLEVAAQKAGGR